MLRWSLLAVLGIGLFAAGGLTYTKAGTQKILGELEPTTSTAPPRPNEVSAVARCNLIPKENPRGNTIDSTELKITIFVNGDIKRESLNVSLYKPNFTLNSTSSSSAPTTATKPVTPSSTTTTVINTWEPWETQPAESDKDQSHAPIVLIKNFKVNSDKTDRRILWVRYTDNAGHAGGIVIAASECTS